MKMKQSRLSALLLGGALCLSVLAGCAGEAPSPGASQSPPAESSPVQGDAAALGTMSSFTAGTLSGGTFTQADIAAKDMTVVNLWSTMCGPCVAEMPDLAQFEKALPDNVRLITVCLDGAEGAQYAQRLLEESGFEGTTLISADGDLAALCRNVVYVPTTVFVDSGGALIGDAMVGGGHKDLSAVYLEALNQALAAVGKDAVSLEG